MSRGYGLARKLAAIHATLYPLGMTLLCLPLLVGLLPGAIQDVPLPQDSWATAIAESPLELREDFAYLVEHLPSRDREGLTPARLLEEVRLAHVARSAVPWGADLPMEVWRNDVLPHCHVNEDRDPMRAKLQARFLERAAKCSTPGEAALMLNSTLFGELGVRYSTERERADQSSKRTVETGLASCTGLSILLADTCRSVGVPARLAGIASWVNKSGNHTWVEVWDGQDWRFLGAAEPDAKGLDHTWFQGDASLAQAGSTRHGIWAVSYGATPDRFPLVWLPGQNYVNGVDVTERYAGSQASEQFRLYVKVLGHGGSRIAADVEVRAVGDPPRRYTARSRDESADTNDVASFLLPLGREWLVSAAGSELNVETDASGSSQGGVELRVGPDDAHLGALLSSDPAQVRRVLWEQYARSAGALGLRADLQGNLVRTSDRSSPFVVREVGEMPASGWPLVIAMHGGGGAPQELNDSQWRHMQIYYKDHPEVSGYRYLALRAPNNSWNGFYDDAIADLIRRLVLAQVLYEGVDPNAVHLIGYSHGGYGAFVIGPKLPDLFASVHSSAAAGTSGETKIANLFAVNFSCMVGELDTSYGRMERCKQFAASMADLAATNPGLYPAQTEIIAGNGHGGLPDRDLLVRQLPLRRELLPKTIIWEPSGADVGEQYWLSIDSPADGQRVEARIKGQRVELKTTGVAGLSLWLDERLVDLTKPLTLVVNGVESSVRMEPSVANARASLVRWYDPERIFSVRVKVAIP